MPNCANTVEEIRNRQRRRDLHMAFLDIGNNAFNEKLEMKARYIQDEYGFYIKEVKKHCFSSWKIVTTIHLGTIIPQLYRKENNNYIPI